MFVTSLRFIYNRIEERNANPYFYQLKIVDRTNVRVNFLTAETD